MVLALILTVAAGLATGLGGLAAFATRRSHTSFLSGSLGFSAGVMIYIAFVELLPSGRTLLEGAHGAAKGDLFTVLSFLGGIGTIAAIDLLVPEPDNPHDATLIEEIREPRASMPLRRAGLLTALAIAIHNFPEGFATLISALHDIRTGAPIAVAIALHNIPEGVSIAVPIFHATGSRKKALSYAFIAGISEPIGALLGLALMGASSEADIVGVAHAAAAGIMVFVSLDQLIPNAKRYESGHAAIYGLVAGLALMAFTLLVV